MNKDSNGVLADTSSVRYHFLAFMKLKYKNPRELPKLENSLVVKSEESRENPIHNHSGEDLWL